jgi:hypothetical protein
MRHPAYILNQSKKLYQKISIYLNCGKSVEILGEKLGLAAFSLFRKKKCGNFFFNIFFGNYLKFATKSRKAFFQECKKKIFYRKNKIVDKYFPCFTLKPKTKLYLDSAQ